MSTGLVLVPFDLSFDLPEQLEQGCTEEQISLRIPNASIPEPRYIWSIFVSFFLLAPISTKKISTQKVSTTQLSC
jgi:hypothetical protein